MNDANWRLKPYDYQWEAYVAKRDALNWGLWWDQGLGKTAEILAQVGHLWREEKITGLLVLAPAGVESNWFYDEVPKWLAKDILDNGESFLWSSEKSRTKRGMDAFDKFRESVGLQILCMSYNAMMTDRGARAARKFLDDHNCFYVVDESSAIKTPDAKTTKRVIASARHAKYRRALNGTPVEDSPFAAYSQIKFLDNAIWQTRGISTYGQFKAMFGEFETRQLSNGRAFPELRNYRNLDLLKSCLHESGQRLLKEDCLELPPKTYTKVYYDLGPKAKKLYRQLKQHFTATTEAGEVVDAELAIVRMTRFQQITSGYFPKDDDGELEPIQEKNARIGALATALGQVNGSVIIFAKYLADIEEIEKLLKKLKMTYGTYTGATSDDERTRIRQDFQDGKIQVFLANKAAAKGLTLTAAGTVIFYNNVFSADIRKQQEDRAHRIGQKKNVLYVDLVARGTIDEHILAVLRRKKELACTVTGDELTSWI